MSKPIEVPENIIGIAKKILEDSTCYGDNSLELANFITAATRPEIEVEPFVIYKVKVRGDDEPRMGFRVSKNVPYPWVTIRSNSPEKESAYPLAENNLIHRSAEIEVIERWTPEAPEIKFGITADDAVKGAEVIVKGSLAIDGVDSDGDVFVTTTYADGDSTGNHVNAADVALLKGGL